MTGVQTCALPIFASVRGCREFFLILAAIGAGQWAIVTFGGEVFRTVPLTAREWAAIIGSTSLLAFAGEAIRALRRRTKRRRAEAAEA